MTLERGIRRVVLSLSLAAAAAGGWFGYGDAQLSQGLAVCTEVAPARREFPGKSDVDALALYNEKHAQFFDSDGKLLPDQSARARAAAEAEVRDVSQCHGLVRRTLTVGVWGLGAAAGVWAVFFFGRWIVKGFIAPILVAAVLLAGSVAPGRALAFHEPNLEDRDRQYFDDQDRRWRNGSAQRDRERARDLEMERLNRYESWDETLQLNGRTFDCRVTISGTLVDRHCEPAGLGR